MAEKVNTFHVDRPAYADLLAFELDFAQICGLILLFSESEGSIAELGSFSVTPKIAKRLLVVIRDFYHRDDSFIKLGPLKQLRNHVGENAVFVLNDDDVGIRKNSLKNLDLIKLRDRLSPAIETRFAELIPENHFDSKEVGDLIKFLTGLVQEFGGLTAEELQLICKSFKINLSTKRIDRLLLCAEAALWLTRDRRGFKFYYFAKPTKRIAASFKFKKKSNLFNSGRRRVAILEYWKANDAARYAGILQFAGSGK